MVPLGKEPDMDYANNLEAWKMLIALSRYGSMSAAAEALGAEVSTLSRSIAGLEKELGRELVNRSHRPVTITEEGKSIAEEAKPIVSMHAALISRLLQASGEMSGVIRLSAAGGLMQGPFVDVLAKFQKLYPGIEFDISRGQTAAACIAGTLDVASVSGESHETGLVQLPRGRSVFIPVASPAYIKKFGAPHVPEDLSSHHVFVYTGPVRAPTASLSLKGETRPLVWKQRFKSTDILFIKRAVMDGLGVSPDMPLLHCHRELAQGTLVPILDGWHRPPISAYAVCTASAWHLKRIRVFMQWYCDFFLEHFQMTEDAARKALGDAFDVYLT